MTPPSGVRGQQPLDLGGVSGSPQPLLPTVSGSYRCRREVKSHKRGLERDGSEQHAPTSAVLQAHQQPRVFLYLTLFQLTQEAVSLITTLTQFG